MMRRLAAQQTQQFFSGNSVRKPRAIMARRDERGAAAAAINDHGIAPKAGQVGGGSQAGRPRTDDQAIESSSLRSFMWR